MKFNMNAEVYTVPFYDHEQLMVDMGITEEAKPMIMNCKIIDCLGQKVVKIDRDKHYWEDGSWSWNGNIWSRWNDFTHKHENHTVVSLGGGYTVGTQKSL